MSVGGFGGFCCCAEASAGDPTRHTAKPREKRANDNLMFGLERRGLGMSRSMPLVLGRAATGYQELRSGEREDRANRIENRGDRVTRGIVPRSHGQCGGAAAQRRTQPGPGKTMKPQYTKR